MATGAVPKRRKDSEKITINLGFVDLGKIELLVAEGFYSNRTDVVRSALRNLLAAHSAALEAAIARDAWVVGLRHYGRAELEALRERGEQLPLRVLGLISLADDVSAELAGATIARLHVLGALHASPSVKTALAERMR